MSVLPSIAPRRRTFTPHVLLFLGMAALSLAYLTFVGMRPDLVAMWRQKPNDAQAAIVETQRNVERALADLDPIKQGVGEMKMEVDNMRTGMQEAMERDRLLLAKVETLERAAAQASEKVAMAPAQPPAKKQAVAKASDVVPAAVASAAPKPAASVRRSRPAASSRRRRRHPLKPAPVGVLLATGPSVDALRLSWSIINDRHGAAVKDLHPRYVVSGKADERTYGLVAGPLETVADAKAMCKTMTENGVACEVSQYRGNAF